MVGALVLLALLYGFCRGPRQPPPPSLPPPPSPEPIVEPPITEMIEPMGGSPQWPQVVPRGVPRFPSSSWEHDDPPPADVVARARALLSTLWARGDGSWRIERTGGRWIAYRAEVVRSGKKGVVVYRVKRASTPQASTPATPTRTATPSPSQPGMVTLRYGDGQPPAEPLRAVALVQEELGVKPVNGRFGPLTREAVRKYQRANGLEPDGVVGPKTWAKLLRQTA